MNIREKVWQRFSRFVSWGMGQIPVLTVWSAEMAFLLAPKLLRRWVDRYTSERILACVVAGELPFLPGLKGGDALLFYPLQQCERYKILEIPELKAQPLFGGKILAIIIPAEQRLEQYHLSGYDTAGRCYDAGLLFSHGTRESTKVNPGIRPKKSKLVWEVSSPQYLTSFLLLHTENQAHAAGYSRRRNWDYPDTRYLPHVVIEPDGTPLESKGLSAMLLVVNNDAWVPEIQVWDSTTQNK